MVARLQLRPSEAAPVSRRELVHVLAALDDDEFASLVDEARGPVPTQGVARGGE